MGFLYGIKGGGVAIWYLKEGCIMILRCVCVCMCVCVMVLKGGGVYYSVRGGGRALWY